MTGILRLYLSGLGVAHVLWLYFFSIGCALRPETESRQTVVGSITDLVTSTVAGMAVAGFGLLFLGFAHILNPYGLIGALFVQIALIWLLKGENWFSWKFWRKTLPRFFRAWTSSAVCVYGLFLVLGLPAVLPATASDSVRYHLAYAIDWSNAGAIWVDPFLRFPYYANNFLLFYSALFVLKVGYYCHFLNWLCGLLTCLGVLAFFAPTETAGPESSAPARWRTVEFLVPLCVGLSPVFLTFLNVAMLDIPIGLFLLAPILCAYRTSSRQPLEVHFVLIAAFCVGMKLEAIVYLPLFLGLFLATWARCLPRRKVLLCVSLLVGLSSPWYVRNFIATSDPVPPLFNFLLKHPDPIFSEHDAAIYTKGTMTDKTPRHLLLLPFLFFSDAQSKNFGEVGVSAAVLLLYLPILFVVAWPWLRQRWRLQKHFVHLSVTILYLILPWTVSSLGRYSLHWYPVFIAWIGVALSALTMRCEARLNSGATLLLSRLAVLAFCCVLIIPFPTERLRAFYQRYYRLTFSFASLGADTERYLGNRLFGYREAKAVIDVLTCDHKTHTRILAFGTEQLHFYFRTARLTSIGDWYGPAGYSDLFAELTAGNCLSYLNRLDISAVIAHPLSKWTGWWDLVYPKLQTQLKTNGYTEYRCRGNDVAIFLRNDVSPAEPLIQAPGPP